MQAAGLVSLFDDPGLVATFYAPTDSGFASTLAALALAPQDLLEDAMATSMLLQAHIIPGLSLDKADFRDHQLYDTLLVDTKGRAAQVQFDYGVAYDQAALKAQGGLAAARGAAERRYSIVPSGGDPARVVEFDLNAGCPAAVHVIEGVLVPAFEDAKLMELAHARVEADGVLVADRQPAPVAAP